MLGFTRFAVCAGDRLICLRNNKLWGLFNGQQMTVENVDATSRRTTTLTIRTDDGRLLKSECLTAQFGRNVLNDESTPEIALLDYGFCVTAHKALGSEWDEVVVIDEIHSTWDPRRWRYTAATRARNRLIYCIK
jgi:exodeoxyribonuclease-5